LNAVVKLTSEAALAEARKRQCRSSSPGTSSTGAQNNPHHLAPTSGGGAAAIVASTRAGTWEARCVWHFQVVPGEIRVIDIDMDLDLTPVERESRMLAKGYLYGSHFLPHDAMATQKIGRTFLMEFKEAELANVKAVSRTYDV
jgi:hypothetical protein